MYNNDTEFLQELGAVPPLPGSLFAGVEAGIRRKRRHRLVVALAAVCALAVLLPTTIVRSVQPAVSGQSSVASTPDTLDITDAILEDAGSLFHEDVSSDQEFLAIALDIYGE